MVRFLSKMYKPLFGTKFEELLVMNCTWSSYGVMMV